jgi:hypothetical protein
MCRVSGFSGDVNVRVSHKISFHTIIHEERHVRAALPIGVCVLGTFIQRMVILNYTVLLQKVKPVSPKTGENTDHTPLLSSGHLQQSIGTLL